MERSQLVELHYIAPIANLRSILANGILSHARVAAHDHVSIAAEVIQDRRESRCVPGGLLCTSTSTCTSTHEIQ